VVDIDRLVVAPAAHRRGTGSALVRAVLDRAAGRRTTVSTGRDNAPARRLYERLGFTCVGEEEVIPALWISRYAHAP
jgi:ribosomal protein S18 acetylase RimI-like enzyme